MLRRWIPWKYLLKRTASFYGLIDPLDFLANLQRFSQPAEVQEPVELLRAGIIFHARGVINTKAIQHNLDWVWPYWVEKQFNPADNAFLPRGFAISHVNLTHRNWTAVGLPNLDSFPLVDPRGLTTPLYDGWSLDFWLVSRDDLLLPSRLPAVCQELETGPELAVRTFCRRDDLYLSSRVWVSMSDGRPWLQIALTATARRRNCRLLVAVRPYNPEGIQFIEEIEYDPGGPALVINEENRLLFDQSPASVHFSNYSRGDVVRHLDEPSTETGIGCDTGMASAAASFPLQADTEKRLLVGISLAAGRNTPVSVSSRRSWAEETAGTAELRIPDKRVRFLYEAGLRTLVLLSAREPVPGPYTYRRFWFRDACLMLNALLAAGLIGRVERLLNTFPDRQQRSGYFQSQKGEWDSNGQVLWICERFLQLSGRKPEKRLLDGCFKGAAWIRKKLQAATGGERHAGLLPPGFSAEHFGPNDYYYWDDFWGAAGLRSAARLAAAHRSPSAAAGFENAFRGLVSAVWRSIRQTAADGEPGIIPASPYRRPDAGAIGSLVADYPLQLTDAHDPWIRNTMEYLLANCFHRGGFFQDIIHSGINAYLTLAVAQTLLRNGDPRYRQLMETVADLASATGQWPEAIHPHTLGGCMGDGQHGWAAAEWIMMVRNLFVREEGTRLIIGSGIFPEWLDSGKDDISFGPTPTPHGFLTVRLVNRKHQWRVMLEPEWHHRAPAMEIRVPGHTAVHVTDETGPVTLRRDPNAW